MRYLSLFFFVFLSLCSGVVFAQPQPSCSGVATSGCVNNQYLSETLANCSRSTNNGVKAVGIRGLPANSSLTAPSCSSNYPIVYSCAFNCSCSNGTVLSGGSCVCPSGTHWQSMPASGANAGSCVPDSCPAGQIPNTISGPTGLETSCIDDPDGDGGDDGQCEPPNIKNIETGACEPKTECEYPLLYDSYTNGCNANPNFCAEGTKPNPLVPGTCISYGNESCPAGWIPINDGLNCAPDGNASSAPGASSAPPASSAGAASSAPPASSAGAASSSGNPSSNPSGGGDDSGSGNGGGGGTGNGGNSGNNGSGSGSASSSNSSGAGSGNGSGGSGECDPTAPNYLDCISRDTGDEGDGLGEINQKDYGLNIDDRLQQARDAYTDRLNQIKDELIQDLSVNLGSGSGSLPQNKITLWGQTIEAGIYARRDFFDAVRWVFLAVASIISLYILLSKN